MKGMTTNTGTNWLGLLLLIYQGIAVMPEGISKQILTGLTLTVAAVVAFMIRGSGLSEEQAKRILEKSDMNEVLKESRK